MHYLNLTGIRSDYPEKWKGMFLRIFLFSSILSNFFWLFAETVYLADNISDLQDNADTISNYVTTVYGMVELITMYQIRKDIFNLTKRLNKLTEKCKKSCNFTVKFLIKFGFV